MVKFKPQYILLKHGLANRLRTIIAFWYIADIKNINFIFHWDITDNECNGKFSDIIESITHISDNKIHIFDTIPSKDVDYIFIGQDIIANILKKFASDNINKCNLIPGSKFIKDIENQYYSKLKPKPYIIDEVNRFFRKNSGKKAKDSKIYYNFCAIHIRRTDHTDLAKKNNLYTSYEEFINFIENCKKDNKLIFLATDDIEVQKKFKNCIIYKEILPINSSNFRQTSLSDAFIDLLIASQCTRFKGSGYSSYSGLIEIYRRINNIL